MFEELKAQLVALRDDKQIFDILAEISKKYYDALLLVGFSREEATTLVADFKAF